MAEQELPLLAQQAPWQVELSKSEATREAERLRIEIRAGGFTLLPEAVPCPAPPPLTFEALGLLYKDLATPRKARDIEAWRKDVKGKLRRVCASVAKGQLLGQKPAGTITEDDLEAFFAQMRMANSAASTRNNYLQMFTGLFRWAVKKGYLEKNPMGPDSDVRRERPARRSRRLIPSAGAHKPEEEERLLVAATNHRIQRLVVAALETACRRGELLKLRWSDVSLERRELTIQGKNAKDGETRILPISSRLAAVLEMAKVDPDGEPHKPDAFVFGEADGSPVKNVKKAWQTACRKANIKGLRFMICGTRLRHECSKRASPSIMCSTC